MQIKEHAVEERCTKHAKELLVGKTIKDVVYLSHMDIEEMLWSKRPLMIYLDDGSLLIPMKDDEGNDGGSLHYHNQKEQVTDTIGVI